MWRVASRFALLSFRTFHASSLQSRCDITHSACSLSCSCWGLRVSSSEQAEAREVSIARSADSCPGAIPCVLSACCYGLLRVAIHDSLAANLEGLHSSGGSSKTAHTSQASDCMLAWLITTILSWDVRCSGNEVLPHNCHSAEWGSQHGCMGGALPVTVYQGAGCCLCRQRCTMGRYICGRP